MTSQNDSKMCKRLKLFHVSGDVLYPVKVRNKDTGVVAFRVSPGGNTKKDSIEVEVEQDMLDYVLMKDYQVRASSIPAESGNTKKRSGLYRLSQSSITKYEYV